MSDSTWTGSAPLDPYYYNDPGNWTSGLPGATDTGFFGSSNIVNIFIPPGSVDVGAWVFLPGASQYNFFIAATGITFKQAGIVINGGAVHIVIAGGLEFDNQASSGGAEIINQGELDFRFSSTADNSTSQH